jgi:dipeptidyl aminopeptidase/acylaminoacyl peptidase
MENVKIDDFAKFKFLSGVKHSPDGKHACFIIHQANLEENKYNSNLWIFDVKEESYYQLTAASSERSFLWMDNENILFADIRDAKDREKRDEGEEFTQYYKININGGEAVKLFKIPRIVNSLKMVDKDSFLFTSDYNANQRELNSLDEEGKTKELKERKEEKDYEVLEEIPFWSNGGGFTNKKRNRLYIYHLASGKVQAITDEYTNVDLFNLKEDSKKAVIIASNFKDKMILINNIMIYDIASKKLTGLDYKEDMGYYYANFIGNDSLIFTGSDMKKYGLNQNEKIYMMDLDSMETSCITPGIDVAMTNSVGSDCRYGNSDLKEVLGDYLYFVTTEGSSSFLNKIDTKGNIEKILTDEGSVDGISISEQTILYIGMKPNKLQELYKKEKDIINQVTKVNEWVQTERKISYPEKVIVETEPGVFIDGWIIKPANYMPGEKYPAIFDIHGGPKTVYGTVFFHEMQYFSSQGYAVFFCNPRGSDGMGNDFADIRGKYGTVDYDDLMKFTDEILKRYDFVDPERLGVTGGSYGGYMTNWIIGHTNRFKAAASQRSISNWISKFNTTDIGYFFVEDQNVATPWNNQSKLWDHSPLKYADKVKTPTLFIHSEEDYRCWIAEAIQMFTALKYHGVEARLCMFREENHELSRSGKPKHRLRRLHEIVSWMDKYLNILNI